MANQKQAVLSDGIWLVVLGIIAIISGIFNVYFAAKIAQGVVSDLREDTYAKIQTFSFGNIKKFSAGSLTTRLINDMNQVMNMMMQLFMQMLRLPILIVGSFIFCIVIIPRFWWAPVVMVALIFGFGAKAVTRSMQCCRRMPQFGKQSVNRRAGLGPAPTKRTHPLRYLL